LASGADPHLKGFSGRTPVDLWPELAEIVKEVDAEKAKAATPLRELIA